MKIVIFWIMSMLLTISISSAQTGLGTIAPDSSSLLDISSTHKGLLPPRMTATDRSNISGPAKGLMVYQTDGVEGLYYNLGTPAVPNWKYAGEQTPAYLCAWTAFTYSLPVNTYTNIDLPVITASNGIVDGGSGASFIITQTDIYRISWQATVTSSIANSTFTGRITVNGIGVDPRTHISPFTQVPIASYNSLTGENILSIAAGSVVRLQVACSSIGSVGHPSNSPGTPTSASMTISELR